MPEKQKEFVKDNKNTVKQTEQFSTKEVVVTAYNKQAKVIGFKFNNFSCSLKVDKDFTVGQKITIKYTGSKPEDLRIFL